MDRLYLAQADSRAAAGSSVELTSIELGVDGGADAPAAVEYIFDNSSQTEVAFSWVHSLSHLDPDFAGYHIERAPIGSTAWLRLTTEPQHETSFMDEDGQDGLERRYRDLAVASRFKSFDPEIEVGVGRVLFGLEPEAVMNAMRLA